MAPVQLECTVATQDTADLNLYFPPGLLPVPVAWSPEVHPQISGKSFVSVFDDNRFTQVKLCD